MTLKGKIQENHSPVNSYQLSVTGLPTLFLTKVTGIEEELEVIELPDRTQASGGQTKPFEFVISQPMHHEIEVAAVEAWYADSKGPVAPGYKKPAILTHSRISGEDAERYSISGCFPNKRKLPDLESANEGDMAVIEWTIKADKIEPI